MALPQVLPKIRTDLIIEEAEVDFSGELTYLIHDEISNKFFHIGEREHQIIQKWQEIAPEEFLGLLNQELAPTVTVEELEIIYTFLFKNYLTEHNYLSLKNLRREDNNITKFIVNNIFFLRLPLVQPDKFLTKTYPYVAWIFSGKFAKIMLGLLLAITFLISRQFDVFAHTFFKMCSFKYFAFYLCGLFLTKIIHELGHAYACKRYNVHVPTIGLAFAVFYPMLFTDTSASWKVKNKNDRMLISLAGVWVEICLAIIALWLWILTPEGPIKSMFFFFGILNIIATFVVNLNPLVKFDGYYVLSDFFSVRNLQSRSFSLAQWKIGEWLWAWNRNPPEVLATRKTNLLITYAFLAMIYRAALFITVAIMVYNLFFKALGIFLFGVEIFYFIMIPLKQEISFWYKNRQDIHWNKNTKVGTFVLALFAFVILTPRKSNIELPATFVYRHHNIFVPEIAQISSIYHQNQGHVKQGEPLFELTSPKIDFYINRYQAIIKKLEGRLRYHTHIANSLDNYHVVTEEIEREKANLASWQHKKQELLVKAPIEGMVEFNAKFLQTGLYLKKNALLAAVIDQTDGHVNVYADEEYIHKISKNHNAEFIPQDLSLPSINVVALEVDAKPLSILHDPAHTTSLKDVIDKLPLVDAYHGSNFGGRIVARPDKVYKPEKSIFKVKFLITQKPDYPLQIIKGQVVLEVEEEALVIKAFKQVINLVIREMGF